MGDNPTHWEGVGRIPPQGGLQTDGELNLVREGRRVEITPAGGRDGGVGTEGGGYLRLPPPEKTRTVHCDQAHYGPVSSGGAETGATGLQEVVIEGCGGCEGDADGILGGGTDGGG